MRNGRVMFALLLWGTTGLAAAEGRWSLLTEKKTGKEVALLQADSKKVIKVLPLDQERVYSPVPYEDIADEKQKKEAMRKGEKFTRLTAKNASATPIDGGKMLIYQEQTIVMPPQREISSGEPIPSKEGVSQEPLDNSILVSLFDQSGKALWSRKFGPLAGRLPVDRKSWPIVPAAPEPAQKEGPPAAIPSQK